MRSKCSKRIGEMAPRDLPNDKSSWRRLRVLTCFCLAEIALVTYRSYFYFLCKGSYCLAAGGSDGSF